MIYVWAGIVILALFLIGRIIRWWNLPAVAAARTKRVEERQKQRTERVRIRRDRRNRPKLPDVKNDLKPAKEGFFRRIRHRTRKG